MFKFSLNSISTDGRVLIVNFLASGLVDLINKISPFIVIPKVIIILGLTDYGKFVFIQTICSYLDLFVNYGFNYTLPVDVSRVMESKNELSKLLSNSLVIKLCLYLFSSVLIGFLFWFFNNSYFFPFVIGSLTTIAGIFQINSFYQGIKEMGYISLFTIISNSLLVILIYFGPITDLESTLLVFSFSQLCPAIFSLLIIRFNFLIGFIPTWRKDFFFETLRRNFFPFISQITVPFYNSIHIVFIKVLLGNLSLGIYSISEKIFNAFCSLQATINRPLLPFLSDLYTRDPKNFKVKIEKYSFSIVIFSVILIVINYFFGEQAIAYLDSSKKFIEIQTHLLTLLCISIPAVFLSSYFQLTYIITNRMKSTFKILVYTAIFNLLIIYPLIQRFSLEGAAIGITISYYFLLIMFLYNFKILKI